ncbi:hypothetical protein H9Q13_04190 [Pontibacter sp. JH31]|uniref:DUF4136 domain-containing protein n=1 Tax=Pontibacter aquaedesilientis TaxID=2766980 RepID=A0ABR7XDH8_9BACT|nr:hypothetical protein [Pontibacter aquaedesilientis]MBD1396353.1 hypothetical protein [Pontibacter aquaedesilientis]
MKRLFYLLCLGVSLTSCVGTKKYATYVDGKLKTVAQTTEQQDWLLVQAPASAPQSSNFIQLESSFIPAIVYWGWNSTIACEVNPHATAEFVKRGIYQAAQNLDVKQRLGGRQLVIELEKVPGQFRYENKGSTIFLVFAHVTTGEELITPRPTDLLVRYKLIENGEVIASGQSVNSNQEQPLRNMWKSTKKFTWMHLELLEREAVRMGAESLIDIVKQLEV